MAAGRIKGITIEIGGDTTKLTKALASVDNALRNTQSNLRDIERALKFNPANTALLRDKQQELAKAIADTKNKIDTEKQAYEQLAHADKTPENIERMRQLKTQIDLDTASLKQLQSQAAQSASVLGTQMQLAGEKIKEVGAAVKAAGEKITGLGRTITQHVTVPIIAGFGASMKAVTDWESAFTGVMKTVDATSSEYSELAENIKKMATETASSKEEIAGVMEVAGQLGIKGVENLTTFTKTMVMLGDTTNLTAEEAATSLARFMNITGESADNVDKIGSAVVDLGNNFATTEAEIVEMATRLASAGTIAGMSSTDILGLSAAMSSVGIQAEAGGTAMSQTLKTMASAVANFKDGEVEDLQVIAQVSNMSAEEFAKAWEGSPVKAMQAFISGLGKVKDSGDNVFATLGQMGMEGIRQTNMLQSLALASNMLSDAIGTSSAAYKENSALSAEAEKRYQTMAAKMNQLKERFKEVAISIGEILMPYIERLMGFIEGLIGKWNALSPAQQEFIVKIAAIAAAVGPVLMIIGTLVTTIGNVISVVGSAVSGIGTLITALSALGAPVLAIIAVIGALVAAFVYFYNTNDEFRAKVQAVLEAVRVGFEALVAQVGVWVQQIMAWVAPIIEAISGYLSALWGLVQTIIGAIFTFIQQKLVENQALISAVLTTVQALWTTTWSNIKVVVQGAVSIIQTIFTTFFNVLGNLMKAVTAAMKGDWRSALEFLKTAATSAVNGIRNIFTTFHNTLRAIFANIITSMKQWGRDMIDNLIQGIKDKISAVKDTVNEVGNAVKERLHFSEPDVGPLSDFSTYAPDMMKLFAQGITDNAGLITDAINKSFNLQPIINANMAMNQPTVQETPPVNVNVVLQGDANRLFRIISAEAERNKQITGRIYNYV